MTFRPSHMPVGDWLQAKYDELARLGLSGGVSLQEIRDGAVIYGRLTRSIGDARQADVIPFPGARVDA